jgi:hypothetical protein
VGLDGAGLAGVQVLRLALDPYDVPILRTQTDAGGTFSLPGVAADSREWVALQAPGYAGVYQAVDTDAEASQSLPEIPLLSVAAASALAQAFGFVLDTGASVVRVPVVAPSAGSLVALPAGEFQVSFNPPLGAPPVSLDGEAIAFNVPESGATSVKVTRGGRACAPARHPELVEADGSVPIGTFAGFFTVAPTMSCP